MALHWLGVKAGGGAGGRDGSYSSLLFMIYCLQLNSGKDECCWTPVLLYIHSRLLPAGTCGNGPAV